MTLPGETEAGSAGMHPCRGIAWWAHRDDVAGRGSSPFALFPKTHRIGRPLCLENPRPEGAEYSLSESELSPLHAEPAHNHGSRTRSKFQYRTPRVITRFEKKKAREITPDAVRDFLADLRTEGLAASSINQCRTILCSVFNYAIRFEKYDKNPVSVVPQEKEPPGRDRFPEPEEIVEMIRVCEEKGDLELKAFLILAPTTGMRKGEILARKWTDIDLDSKNPSINVRITKNREPKRIQLPDIAVDALRALPSYGHHEYVFPAKANPRFQGNFKKPHAWDLGKRFRRVRRSPRH